MGEGRAGGLGHDQRHGRSAGRYEGSCMRDAVDSLRARAQGDGDEFLIREWAHELGSEDQGMLSQIDGAISGQL